MENNNFIKIIKDELGENEQIVNDDHIKRYERWKMLVSE
jgi:hypothetical protein